MTKIETVTTLDEEIQIKSELISELMAQIARLCQKAGAPAHIKGTIGACVLAAAVAGWKPSRLPSPGGQEH